MSTFTRFSFRLSGILSACGLAVLIAIGSVASAQQQAANQPPAPPDFAQGIGEEISGKLGPLLAPENLQADAAIAVIDRLLADPRVKPDSYDLAFLSNIKGKLLIGKEDNPGSVAALETVFNIVEKFPHFLPDLRERVELTRNIAVAYLSMANEGNVPGPQKKAQLEKAEFFMKRFLDISPIRQPQDYRNYAYTMILRIDVTPENEVRPLIEKAENVLVQGTRAGLQTPWEFYDLLVTLNQMKKGRDGNPDPVGLVRAAEYLELIIEGWDLKQPAPTPREGTHWEALANIYAMLGRYYDEEESMKDPRLATMYNVRSINAFKRGQARGFVNADRHQMAMLGLYYNMNQIGLAAEVMEKGLRSGTIPNEPKNWRYLAGYFTTLEQEDKAIAIIKEATTKFPNDGSFDLQLSQSYYAEDKLAEARDAAKTALRKGIPDREGQTWMFVAVCAYYLEDWADAKDALTKAIAAKDAPDRNQSKNLMDAIDEQLKHEEELKAQKAAAAK